MTNQKPTPPDQLPAEIKRCPFCGSQGEYYQPNEDVCVISCTGCNAEGGYYGGEDSTTPEEALKFWNTRAALTAADNRVPVKNEAVRSCSEDIDLYDAATALKYIPKSMNDANAAGCWAYTFQEIIHDVLEDASKQTTPILNSGCEPKNKAPCETSSTSPAPDDVMGAIADALQWLNNPAEDKIDENSIRILIRTAEENTYLRTLINVEKSGEVLAEERYRDYTQGVEDARAVQQPVWQWRTIGTQPFDQEVLVLTYDGCVLKAKYVADAGMDEDEKPVNQWQATTECYPPCWSGGECWASNEEEMVSDWPIAWTPLPPIPASEA